MVTCCSHCGADLSSRPVGAALGRWEARCPDCGLDAEGEAPTLPPGGDEVEYDVEDWPPGDRIRLREGVSARGLPWRWGPGPVLVVPEGDEEVVEAVLDQMDAEEEEEEGEEGDAGAGPFGAEAHDEEAAAADEVSHGAMSDLFVAADRLWHAPSSETLVAEVDGLRSLVADTGPPFGMDAATWNDIARLSGAVVDAAEAGDEDQVRQGARALRDFLREYI